VVVMTVTTRVRTPYWWRDAACAQVGEEWFFGTGLPKTKGYHKAAVGICASCPVLRECRESLVKESMNGFRGDQYGFRAGMTPKEQRAYIAELRRAAI
jgi:hypothetical protein